jgi:hypothetical protein
MAIWRYDSAGNPVGAFNGGLVTHHNAAGGGGDDIGYGIALSGTDVVVAGESEGANYADMAVWKYTSAGALKNEFNGTGYRTINGTAGGAGNDRGYAVAVDGTDIIVAGESTTYRTITTWLYGDSRTWVCSITLLSEAATAT